MKAPLAIAAAIAVSAFGLQPAAQAAPDASAPRACFYVNQINSYRADGDAVVYAGSGSQRIFRINMAAPCHNLRDAQAQLVIEPTASGAVCSGASLTMTAVSSGIPERCFVGSIDRLTPDEIASLPARLRP